MPCPMVDTRQGYLEINPSNFAAHDPRGSRTSFVFSCCNLNSQNCREAERSRFSHLPSRLLANDDVVVAGKGALKEKNRESPISPVPAFERENDSPPTQFLGLRDRQIFPPHLLVNCRRFAEGGAPWGLSAVIVEPKEETREEEGGRKGTKEKR